MSGRLLLTCSLVLQVSAELRNSYDQHLALTMLVEGEARLHETRANAAMLGLDLEHLDLAMSVMESRCNYERMLFGGQVDLFGFGSIALNYGYGADWAFRLWQAEGSSAIRHLMDAAPPSVLDALSQLWFDESAADITLVPYPDDTVYEGNAPAMFTRLGPWGIYLETHAQLGEQTAREVATAWRGDQLEAFNVPQDVTVTTDWAVRWTLEFATTGDVEDFLRGLPAELRTETRTDQTSVVLVVWPNSSPPEWLFGPLGMSEEP